MKVMVIPVVIRALSTVIIRISKLIGRLRNRTGGYHPNCSIIKIDKINQKSTIDLRNFDIKLQWKPSTHTLLKNSQSNTIMVIFYVINQVAYM